MSQPAPFDPSFHPSNPQQVFRTGSDWTPRDYGVPEPKIIPPAPLFEKWVPAPDTIAFGDLPKDASRYQSNQDRASAIIAAQPPPPAPPPTVGSSLPQVQPWIPWALRDYAANQDMFSVLATPLPPQPNPYTAPQHNARPDWTLRDYSANQDRQSALLAIVPPSIVPAPDIIAFGELPRDMTVHNLLMRPVLFRSGPVPPPKTIVSPVPPIGERPRDRTPELLVISQANLATYLAIPVVPAVEPWTFDYEPLEMTPYLLATRILSLPPSKQPQIPPAIVPDIERPLWRPDHYQAFQDQFSALATPSISTFPVGLQPIFTLEALIREIPRAQNLPLTFMIPPPPPRVVPSPPTYLAWRDWTLNEYRQQFDQLSAFLASLPLPPGFRVQAVTAGTYGGWYYRPGDQFDLLTGLDFSDASKNYQVNGNIWAPGWMMKIGPSAASVLVTESGMIITTESGQALTTESTGPAPQFEVNPVDFPVVDPKRRFVM